jgi:AcrR family transcriptional regulator
VAGILRPLFPLPAMATWHLETAVQSARALRALEPSRLAVGHGPVLEAPLGAMDQAIAVAERKVGNKDAMPSRAGLDRVAVIQAAADLADSEGWERLTLAMLAERLGIRTPSLYNHMAGLEGLRRDLAVLACRELAARLAQATIGKARDEAVLALAQAYRAFARERPGLYAAISRALDPTDQEAQAAAGAVVEIVLAVLAAYGLHGDDAIHTTRALRSALHGFVTLEASGGFGIPLDLDESFRRLVQLVLRGIGPPAT